MSQQGPIVTVSNRDNQDLTNAVAEVKAFPLLNVEWPDAADAIRRLRPAAILMSDAAANQAAMTEIAGEFADAEPYLPLIALDAGPALPRNVLPFTPSGRRSHERLVARLNAALRVRALHATLLRRLSSSSARAARMPVTDPLDDATVLLVGRGASHPALSVALGQQMGVIGALSIEAAAKHLGARELDGIIIGNGFTPRVIDAFLMVLSEDSRFRNLPIVVGHADGLAVNHDLPNLEIIDADPQIVAAHAVPLIRQQAFEARVGRVLKSIDVGGLLDPRTGLLTREAFASDFEAAVAETKTRGAGLSVVRISFGHGTTPERMRLDAARILSRLMRRMDFATLDGPNAILVVLAEANLRDARMVARRLSSVLKHTMFASKRERRLEPETTVATLMPNDTASSLLGRLHSEGQRAAS